MSRKTSSAIDFATYGLEDARKGLNGTTETIPLMTEQARPVAKQTKQTVDWQHAAEKISCGLSLICLGHRLYFFFHEFSLIGTAAGSFRG